MPGVPAKVGSVLLVDPALSGTDEMFVTSLALGTDPPLLLAIDKIEEAKFPIHKMTADKVYIYIKSAKNKTGVQVQGVKHSQVHMYAHKMTTPPPGHFEPVGQIDPFAYGGPEDAEPVEPGGGPVAVTQPKPKKPKKPKVTADPSTAPPSLAPGAYQHSGVTLKKSAGGVMFNVPFNPTFVGMLKKEVPSYNRSWNEVTKEWTVDPSEEEKVLGLLKDHFGFESKGAAYSPTISPAPGSAAGPVVAPPPPAPTVKPPPKPKKQPMQVGPLEVPKIPSPSDLSVVGSGKHLGGAGEKTIYQDASGQQWIFKVAATKGGGKEKPFAAAIQQASSSVAKLVKPGHIDVGVATLHGQLGTLQPLVSLGHPSDLASTSPSSLKPSEQLDVAQEHVLDWMMSQHDSHGANLLRTADGKIIGVDKEQGFKHFGDDKLAIDYHPNEKYGQSEPYYNRFWRDWSEKKFDFDPKQLAETIEKIGVIGAAEYEATLRPYADARFADDDYEKEKFLRGAVARKATLKQDYEKFVNDLYQKREGKGNFSFAGGWVPAGSKASGPKTKTVTMSAVDMASQAGISTKAYKDKSGKEDPDILVLRVSNSQNQKVVEDFAKELGLDILDKKTGGTYHLFFVNKHDFEKAKITKEVPIEDTAGIPKHPGPPDYLPSVGSHELVRPNLSEMNSVHTKKDLGLSGKRFSLGGDAVVGSVGKVKRIIGTDGEERFQVSFKLSEGTRTSISGGDSSSSSYGFTKSVYDPDKDAIVPTSPYPEKALDTKKWSVPGAEIHLASKSGQWSFAGNVYADIKLGPGETVPGKLKALLDQMQPGLSDKVLKDPSPADKLQARARALLESVAPQVADKAGESASLATLVSRLNAAGLDEADIGQVREVEVRPGHSTHVKPGRWRDIAKTSSGKPALRFLLHAVSSPDKIVTALKEAGGLMPVTERMASGITFSGASVDEDIATGGADSVQCRVMTESGDHSSLHTGSVSGGYQYIIAPDEVDRLDLNMHPGDNFGCSNPGHGSYGHAWKNRKPLADAIQSQQNSYHSSAELLAPKGISSKKFLRITTEDEDKRKTLLKKLKAAEIHEVNGVPVEDFVVVASSVGQTYERYVKPLGY